MFRRINILAVMFFSCFQIAACSGPLETAPISQVQIPTTESTMEFEDASTETVSPVEEPASPLGEIDRETLVNEIDELVEGRLKKVDLEYEDNPAWIYVRWNFEGDGTNQMIANQAKRETTAILDALYHGGLEYNQVTLSGWYTITIDINNNLEYIELLSVQYDRETLDQINWDTVRSQYIWLIADRSMINSLLEEE